MRRGEREKEKGREMLKARKKESAQAPACSLTLLVIILLYSNWGGSAG